MSKLIEKQQVHKGKWLLTERIEYLDPEGNNRIWESIRRTNVPENKEGVDSTCAIAILKKNLHKNRIILVKQYRPPLDAYCIEMPAGLCDEGETVEESILRELYEETGYTGFISKHNHGIHLGTSLDPGVEDSKIAFISVTVDGNDPKNIGCKQKLDDGEFIEVLLLPVTNLFECLCDYVKEDKNNDINTIIDSRLYAFAKGIHIGMSMQSKLQDSTLTDCSAQFVDG